MKLNLRVTVVSSYACDFNASATANRRHFIKRFILERKQAVHLPKQLQQLTYANMIWSNMELLWIIHVVIPVWSHVFTHCSTTSSFYPNGFSFRVWKKSNGQRIHAPPQIEKKLHLRGIRVFLLNLGALFEGTKRGESLTCLIGFFGREHNFKNLAHTIDCEFPSLK